MCLNIVYLLLVNLLWFLVQNASFQRGKLMYNVYNIIIYKTCQYKGDNPVSPTIWTGCLIFLKLIINLFSPSFFFLRLFVLYIHLFNFLLFVGIFVNCIGIIFCLVSKCNLFFFYQGKSFLCFAIAACFSRVLNLFWFNFCYFPLKV